MKLNSDYKNSARLALKGNWAPSVIAAIVFMLIVGCICGTTAMMPPYYYMGGYSALISIFAAGPLSFGFVNAFKRLYLYSDQNVTRNTFTEGFSDYLHIVGGFFLMWLYTLLWSFLLIIPGFVKAYSYSMTPYILVDNPELGADQAIHRSRQLMHGHKMDLFLLDLSFIGWAILGVITMGIGFLWITPFFYTTRAAFYEDVKAEWEARNLTNSTSSTDEVLTGTISRPNN